MQKDPSWLKDALKNVLFWVPLATIIRPLYKLLACLYAVIHFGHKFQTLSQLNSHHNESETSADLLLSWRIQWLK